VKRLFVLLLLLLLALLPACGGGKKNAAGVKQNGTTSSSVAGSDGAAAGGTSTTAKGGKGGTTSTTAKGGAAEATGGSTTTTKPHVPVVIKLDRKCVRRGATGDSQGISVTTDPNDIVGYSTEYSDHSNELTNPSYKTGSGYGNADDKGKYHTEWKLPDNATPGTATLRVIAEGKIQPPLTFKVVDQLGKC
jgi:hypothetical protein